MKDQKDKQCRFIFYSKFSSYLPGMPSILTMSVAGNGQFITIEQNSNKSKYAY